MKLFRKINISENIKNISRISTGTIVGQMISIVTLPIITRLYGPQIMGIWAGMTAISFILQAISDLGLTSTIIVEDDDKKVLSLYTMVTTLCLILSIISSIILIPLFIIKDKVNINTAVLYTFCTISHAFLTKQVQTCYFWLNREKKYGVLMKNPIINYSVVAIFAILFSFIGFKTFGYYIAVILGQFITLIHMRKQLPSKLLNFDIHVWKYYLVKYKSFIKFQMPTSLMNQFKEQLPNILIGSFFGDAILGYYSVTLKILNMPVTFIGQAIGKVFIQTISEMERLGKNISDFVSKNFTRSINIAAIPIALLFALGDLVAVIFFGSDYVISGMFLRIIVFKTFFVFVTSCMQGLEIVLKKQKYLLYANVIQMIFALISIIIGYCINNVFIGMVLMVVTYVVVQIIYYQKLYDVMNITLKKDVIKMLKYLIITILFSLFIRFVGVKIIEHFTLTQFEWFSIM